MIGKNFKKRKKGQDSEEKTAENGDKITYKLKNAKNKITKRRLKENNRKKKEQRIM